MEGRKGWKVVFFKSQPAHSLFSPCYNSYTYYSLKVIGNFNNNIYFAVQLIIERRVSQRTPQIFAYDIGKCIRWFIKKWKT